MKNKNRNRAWRRAKNKKYKGKETKCSCFMCGNPRKYFDGLEKYTLQEKKLKTHKEIYNNLCGAELSDELYLKYSVYTDEVIEHVSLGWTIDIEGNVYPGEWKYWERFDIEYRNWLYYKGTKMRT